MDDDPSVRKGLSRLLRSAGYDVEVFSSATEFLARARSGVPRSALPAPRSSAACLVLDLQMPGQSGLDLQQSLTRPGYSLPIVFITGHGDIPASVRAMKKGAVDFLTKPFDDQALLDAIAVALSRDQAARARQAESAEIRGRVEKLTPRERDVMNLVITGMLNKQIAAELCIEPGTVKVHRGRMMTKMGVQSVAELVSLNSEL